MPSTRFLFLLLLIPYLSYSQKEPVGFNDGYVVKNENDTLYGLVKNRAAFPYRFFSDVRFKANENADEEKFTADEIKGYGIGNFRYESKYLPSQKTKGFYKLLIKGYLSYYQMEEQGWGVGNYSYYIVFEKETGEYLSFLKDNISFPFKRKVSEFLIDDPDLSKKVKTNIYHQGHLGKIVREYNSFHTKAEAPAQ